MSSFAVENRWFSVNLLETLSAFLHVALAASRLCNNALLLVYQIYICFKVCEIVEEQAVAVGEQNEIHLVFPKPPEQSGP